MQLLLFCKVLFPSVFNCVPLHEAKFLFPIHQATQYDTLRGQFSAGAVYYQSDTFETWGALD